MPPPWRRDEEAPWDPDARVGAAFGPRPARPVMADHSGQQNSGTEPPKLGTLFTDPYTALFERLAQNRIASLSQPFHDPGFSDVVNLIRGSVGQAMSPMALNLPSLRLPQVSAPMVSIPDRVAAPSVSIPAPVSAPTVSIPSAIAAPQIAALPTIPDLPQVALPQVAFPTVNFTTDNPWLQQFAEHSQKRIAELQQEPFSAQEEDRYRTRALERIEADRAASRQRALEDAARRGVGESSGVIQERFRDVDRSADTNRAVAERDLAIFQAEERQRRRDLATQVSQLLAAMGQGEAARELQAQMAAEQINSQMRQSAASLNQQGALSAADLNQRGRLSVADLNQRGRLSVDQANQGAQLTAADLNQRGRLAAESANQGAFLSAADLNQRGRLAAESANQGAFLSAADLNQRGRLSAESANQQAALNAAQLNQAGAIAGANLQQSNAFGLANLQQQNQGRVLQAAGMLADLAAQRRGEIRANQNDVLSIAQSLSNLAPQRIQHMLSVLGGLGGADPGAIANTALNLSNQANQRDQQAQAGNQAFLAGLGQIMAYLAAQGKR